MTSPVASRDQDRDAALVRAYHLVEQIQFDAEPSTRLDEIDRLAVTASRRDWPDVEFVLEYARFAAAADQGRGGTQHAARLLDAAQRSGDDVLMAMALAARATVGAFGPRVESSGATLGDPAAGARDLARAVALLDAEGHQSVHAPAAYLECAISYLRRDLWELAIEMFEQARTLFETAPAFTGPPGQRLVPMMRRVTRSFMPEIALPLVCAYAELGERELARQVALPLLDRPASVVHPPEFDPGDHEAMAARALLAAVAGSSEPAGRSRLLERLDPSRRQRYRAMVWLADAVRHLDGGDAASCAASAEIALQHDDPELPDAVRSFALSLAAAAEPPTLASRRHTRALAVMRWRSRVATLDAARTALESERLMLDHRRLSQRAYVDELTGLGNRHAFARYLERMRTGHGERVHGLVVLMVDVDRFKEVNDNFGHAVGDEVLRRIGELLGGTMRVTDFGVRLGGDEFLLLLVGTGPLDVDERGRYLVEAVRAHPWSEISAGLAVTVSVGVSVGPGARVDDLISAADAALYRAKARGRDQVVRLVDVSDPEDRTAG